jgi:hypothetical protein
MQSSVPDKDSALNFLKEPDPEPSLFRSDQMDPDPHLLIRIYQSYVLNVEKISWDSIGAFFVKNESFFFWSVFIFLEWIEGKNLIEGKQSFLNLFNAKINSSPDPHWTFLGILDTAAPSVADPDPGSGAFLTPRAGIRDV